MEQQDPGRGGPDLEPLAVSYPPVSGGNTLKPVVRTLTNTTQKPRSRFGGRENPATI